LIVVCLSLVFMKLGNHNVVKLDNYSRHRWSGAS